MVFVEPVLVMVHSINEKPIDSHDGLYVCRHPFPQALPTLTEAVAEEVFQIGDVINFLHGFINVVLDTMVSDDVVIECNIASPPIAVTRLAHGADVAQGFATVEFVGGIDVIRREELQILGENPRNVGVTLEAVFIDERVDSFHLPLIVNIFGEDIFIEWIACRAMNKEMAVLAV